MRSLLLVLICVAVPGLCRRKHRGRAGQAMAVETTTTWRHTPTQAPIDITTTVATTVSVPRGEGLSGLFWGSNGSTKGNLQSALTVLAPENLPKTSHASESRVITPNYAYDAPESASSVASENGRGQRKHNNSKSGDDVVLEVINIGSYPVSRSRYDVRFIAVTSLYVLSGVFSLIVTYCLAKAIMSRRKRQRQYTLLTKSEMDYHRGGGGI